MKESEESKFKAEIDAIESRIRTILKNIEKVAPINEEEEAPAATNDHSGDSGEGAEPKAS